MKAKKKEGAYTIWIFRGGPSTPIKIKLPERITKILFPVVIAIIISFPFITTSYISKSLRLINIAKESKEQTTYIAALNKKVEEFQQHIQRLKEFDVKLRIIANLENASETESFLGVGGVTPRESWQEPETDLQKLRAELDRLCTEAEFREKSFQELHSFLEGKKRELACTPAIWPVRGWLTSGFGYRIDPFTGLRQFHEGLDIANRLGTPIVASADGIVSRCSNNFGFGLTVEINHGYGLLTRYAHLSKAYVRVGQRVKRGDRIAAMGNSGRATGPHLHYEVRLNNVPINPRNYILN
ncbi:MAG: peptidoglycan DD-metalloendopeptidase family protein [Deltaproteobacteria bacterium]|nr:peptidoglycan DD-metalloendopeptidase family protein [Deltaproteobacteria bacterium]